MAFPEPAHRPPRLLRTWLQTRRRYLLLGLLAMLAIGAASLPPEEIKAKLHTHGPLHSTLHILAFTAMAYFAFRSVRSLRAHVLLIAAGVALGLGSELAEHLFYGSSLEYRDIAADCIGVLLGSTLAAALRRRRTRKASHPIAPDLTS